MGFFGLFKKKPMKPKAPQFAPPSSPHDKPPDLLDEFPDHATTASEVPPLPPSQSSSDNSLADVSDADFEFSQPQHRPSQDNLDLPDFSTDEINAAKQLEEQVNNASDPVQDTSEEHFELTVPQDDDVPDIPMPVNPSKKEQVSEKPDDDWSAPLEHISFSAKPSDWQNVRDWSSPASMAESSQQSSMDESSMQVPSSKDPEEHLSTNEWPAAEPLIDQNDSLAFQTQQYDQKDDYAAQSTQQSKTDMVPDMGALPAFEESTQENWDEQNTSILTEVNDALDDDFQQSSLLEKEEVLPKTQAPWEHDPLPVLDETEAVVEAAKIPDSLPNEMFLPVLQYKEALESVKDLKDILKKSNGRLSGVVKNMGQNKTKFSDFAEDLRSIEVDLLRMDEVLR